VRRPGGGRDTAVLGVAGSSTTAKVLVAELDGPQAEVLVAHRVAGGLDVDGELVVGGRAARRRRLGSSSG
jgi:hypothetical protein